MCSIKACTFSIPHNELINLKIDHVLTKKQLNEKDKKIKEGKGINLTLTTTQMRKIKSSPKEHIGGFIFTIPAILAALGAVGSLAGGAAAIAKTVVDAKKNKEELGEQKRHNLAIEEKQGGKVRERKSKN